MSHHYPLHMSLLCLVTILFGACATIPKSDPSEEDWQALFNGRDMQGWDVKIRGYPLHENFNNTFVVRDGLLTVDYSLYERFDETFGHLFYNTPYSYYMLRAQYRFVGEQVNEGPGWAFRNNGLMIHSQSAASMGIDQDFPISIEVQLLGGDGLQERSTANLCTPGTHVVMDGLLFEPHCVNSTSQTYHGDQWVTVEVVALGDSLITHRVEGVDVLTYTHPQRGGGNVSGHNLDTDDTDLLLRGGYIAIQAESHPTQFKKIEILNLEGCMDPKAKNYKNYFVKHLPSACKYSAPSKKSNLPKLVLNPQ